MISKRAETYTESLFQTLASGQVQETLQKMSETLKDTKINDFFNSSIISVSDKKQCLLKVIKDESKEVQNFLCLLLDQEAFSLLPEIAQNYEERLNAKSDKATGTIYSKNKLSESEAKEIQASVEKLLKKKVSLTNQVDESLVGGLCIKIGDYIIDDTINTHLQKFKNSKGGM